MPAFFFSKDTLEFETITYTPLYFFLSSDQNINRFLLCVDGIQIQVYYLATGYFLS